MNNLRLDELAKAIFTNRGYLYFILFLSVIINLGYLMANKLDAFALFLAIGVITKCFSDNMAIVLTVSLLATCFAMSYKVKEGFSGGTESVKEDKKMGDSKKKVGLAYKTSEEHDIVNPPDPSQINDQVTTTTPLDDEKDDIEDVMDEAWDEASGFKPMNSKSKLDYGATVKQSYMDLNKFLDPEAIKSLTKDTSELMNQQEQLYSSMKTMTPLLGQAKTFIKDFNGSDVKNMLSLK
jgi:hypothetical protein